MEVRLESYSNPDHEHCDGGHCEFFPSLQGDCDNIFMFCVRVVGTTNCLAVTRSDFIEKDELTFNSAELSTLGISNPLLFSGIMSTVRSYDRR